MAAGNVTVSLPQMIDLAMNVPEVKKKNITKSLYMYLVAMLL